MCRLGGQRRAGPGARALLQGSRQVPGPLFFMAVGFLELHYGLLKMSLHVEWSPL